MKPPRYVPQRFRREPTRLCQLQRDGRTCARPARLTVGPEIPVCDDCYVHLLAVQQRTAAALLRRGAR